LNEVVTRNAWEALPLLCTTTFIVFALVGSINAIDHTYL
jgi:hypothetical protein